MPIFTPSSRWTIGRSHWLFMSILLFALYPFSKKRSPLTRMSVPDGVLLVVSVGICLWIFINSTAILNRAGTFGTMDVVMGTILVLIVLEAARRAAGLAVPLIAVVFIGYALFGPYLPDVLAHKGYSIQRLCTYLSLSTDGIFGVPIGVSANFILLFILYGALLRKTGAGQFFTDVAFALTGWTRGGPAKAAVVSSAFFGMISGSSVANTVTTGTFTIPLMKRTGYPAHFAGGVEAASSTMGQIMPPIMGAAAFIMAEFLSVPYYKVCIAAAIPATLAFFSTFMQVHFRAVSMGLVGLPRNELPKIGAAFAAGWHHLFSIFLLIAFLTQDFSPERAVFWAIIATIATSFLMCLIRKESLKAFGKLILEGSGGGRSRRRRGGRGLRRGGDHHRLHHDDRPGNQIFFDDRRRLHGKALPGPAVHYDCLPVPGDGRADDGPVCHHHRAGGARPHPDGGPAHGRPPVHPLFRNTRGHHAPRGPGRLCGGWHRPCRTLEDGMGGLPAWDCWLYHPVYVRLCA